MPVQFLACTVAHLCVSCAISQHRLYRARCIHQVENVEIYFKWFALQLILNRTLQPLCLGGFVSHFNGSRSGGNVGGRSDSDKDLFGYPYVYVCAVGIIGCAVLSIVVKHPFVLYTMHLGIKMRLSCCAMIYRKVCRVTPNWTFRMPFQFIKRGRAFLIAGAKETQIDDNGRLQ